MNKSQRFFYAHLDAEVEPADPEVTYFQEYYPTITYPETCIDIKEMRILGGILFKKETIETTDVYSFYDVLDLSVVSLIEKEDVDFPGGKRTGIRFEGYYDADYRVHLLIEVSQNDDGTLVTRTNLRR